MSASGSMSTSESNSETRDLTPREFKDLRGNISDTLLGLISSGGGVEFAGPFTAPLGAAELDALGNINASPSALNTAASGQLRDTLGGAFLDPNSQVLQDFIATAARPINQAFDERDLETRALFARAGQSLPESSPFARAQSINNRGRADALGDVSSRIAFENFNNERNRQVQATSQATELDRLEFDKTIKVLESRALPRLIEQFGVDRGFEEFRRRQDVLMNALGLAGGLASPKGQLGTFSDSESKSISQSGGICWVAAEYYGWFTPSWWDARNWIAEGWTTPTGRLFLSVYTRFGERVAAAVCRSRVVRLALRPLFAWAARKGREMRE